MADRKHNAASGPLRRGRACFDRREWNDAFEALSLADALQPLAGEDLERLARAAGLTARDDVMMSACERAYEAWLAAGEHLAAARSAFWLGFRLLALGEMSRANGWLARAARCVEIHGEECVEQGYLLLPASQRHLHLGEGEEAYECASRAVAMGERFADADLLWFARNLQGRALLRLGRIEDGLKCLDEAMLAVVGGELSPVVTGILYCTSIASCHRVFAIDRVREWTDALAGWCAAQPQLGTFAGNCHVHRAEVMELSGCWSEAVEEAKRAVERCIRSAERSAAGNGHYRQAEILRLWGHSGPAEQAYKEASRLGYEPQPGLALLRLSQGRVGAAASAARRLLAPTSDAQSRLRHLPACVEILLAAGECEVARAASEELNAAATGLGTPWLVATAACASAAVELADGNPSAVLTLARRAFAIWQQIGAPYCAARCRVQLARACIALGDVEGARLELDAAREVFAGLGAAPDLATLDGVLADLAATGSSPPAGAGHGLTGRELQVLRLVASGQTNKSIARDLALSERTVDRHVSNVFGKIAVSSRAAATAYAYKRGLV